MKIVLMKGHNYFGPVTNLPIDIVKLYEAKTGTNFLYSDDGRLMFGPENVIERWDPYLIESIEELTSAKFDFQNELEVMEIEDGRRFKVESELEYPYRGEYVVYYEQIEWITANQKFAEGIRSKIELDKQKCIDQYAINNRIGSVRMR